MDGMTGVYGFIIGWELDFLFFFLVFCAGQGVWDKIFDVLENIEQFFFIN